MSIILSKDLIGKEIWGRTTGNNARDGDTVVRFKVVDVKRKYFDLMQYKCAYGEDNFGVGTYCPKSGATKVQVQAGYGLNSGYDFYTSLAEVLREVEKKEQLTVILKYNHRLNELSPEKVQIIFDVINGEFGEA